MNRITSSARVLVILCAMGVVGRPPAIVAESGQETLPQASAEFARHVMAIGGEAAVRQHSHRRVIGRMEIPAQNMRGRMEVLAATPNRYLSRLHLEGLGESQRGFDGQTGWIVQPGSGAARLSGSMLLAIQDEASFYRDLYQADDISGAQVIGTTDFAGKRAYEVHLIRRSGPASEYFDVESGLLLGTAATHATPMGRMQVTTELFEYREFGNLRHPTRIVVKTGPIQTIVAITDVSYGPIEESVFVPPMSLRIGVAR